MVMAGMKQKPAVVLPMHGITKYFRPSEESNVSSSDEKGDTNSETEMTPITEPSGTDGRNYTQ